MQKRKPTFVESIIPLFTLALFLGVGFGVYTLRVELLLLGTAVVSAIVAGRLGYTYKELEEGITTSIGKSLPAIYIMIMVGWMISTWIAAGTVPMLIYHGLGLISIKYFLVTASIVCAIVSVLTGTSYGTAGTVGVVFMGIAASMNIPLAHAAGAIVAGAYFGDKLSPFSDTTNLAPLVAGANLYDHIKHMLWTTVPAFSIGLVIYFFMGLNSGSSGDSTQIATVMQTMQEHFTFNWWLMLPPGILLYCIFTKRPVVPGMMMSAACAMGLAMLMQGQSLSEIFVIAVKGFKSTTGVASVDKLLSKGGMVNMMQVTLLALCAFGFGGIIQKAGMLDVILEKLIRFTETTAKLFFTVISSVLCMGFLTGSSYLCILIPGEMFAPIFREKGLAAKNLSRTLEDSGTVLVPLLPWSVAGVFMAGTLGVNPAEYWPFAFMNYLGMVIAVIYGKTGIGIAKKTTDDETVVGS